MSSCDGRDEQVVDSCSACPLGDAIERRAFLRDAAVAAAGIFATLGIVASEAKALPIRLTTPLAARADERTYPIPTTDGATIDKEESIIVVRWQGEVYVFSLACPHQNTALKWAPQDAQFQCPKHHSKYRPDGSFIEGRATRGMDRFAVRRDGDKVVVDLDKLYQQDKDAAEWKAASIQV
ncbi:MAG TPA: Rieske (2Fe-2S) protein [Gemmatimonadaceae bacterium]|nr:Rieske (2Fe-2S) protein [Gemmatimonadaceae bacterium]